MLPWAARRGHSDVMHTSTKQYDMDANRKENDGRQALYCAARGGDLNAIRTLIAEYGVNCKDSDGRTALHWAVIGCQWEAIDMLVNQYDMDIKPILSSDLVDFRYVYNLSKDAAKNPLLEYLYSHGSLWVMNACVGAAGNGHLDCLKYLHENGCPRDERVCRSDA